MNDFDLQYKRASGHLFDPPSPPVADGWSLGGELTARVGDAAAATADTAAVAACCTAAAAAMAFAAAAAATHAAY